MSRVRRTCAANLLGLLCLLVTVLCIVIFLLALTAAPRTLEAREDGDHLPAPGASTDRLFWFMQVSDVHISVFHENRIEQFDRFCNSTVPAVNPTLVLCTGDMTDGYGREDKRSSFQQEDEWIAYRQTLERYGYDDPSFWLDIRGNHDNYGVPERNGEGDYFPHYAMHGQDELIVHDLNLPFGSYRFVSFDGTMLNGPRPLFQFFAIPPPSMDRVLEAVETSQANHTILFGHYPRVTSVAALPWDRLSQASTLHLCGHLHAGQMYMRVDHSHFELEVRDMKTSKFFRVIAFDHDMFSFADGSLDEWPLIVVTNPKRADMLSEREPFTLMQRSSHIRVLIFAPAGVTTATARIDNGETVTLTRVQNGHPLFVAPWNTAAYAHGVHTLVVNATDAAGNTRQSTTVFTLDATTAAIQINGSTALQNANAYGVLVALAVIFTVYIVGALVFSSRVYVYYLGLLGPNKVDAAANEASPLRGPPTLDLEVDETPCLVLTLNYRRLLLLKHGLLAQRYWWFFAVWAVWLMFLPMMIGDFHPSSLGVAFSWGLVMDGIYTPSVEMILMYLAVLLLIYAPAYQFFVELDDRTRTKTASIGWFPFFLFIVFFIFWLVAVLLMMSNFGWVAGLFSPIPTWFGLAVIPLAFSALMNHRRRVEEFTHYRFTI